MKSSQAAFNLIVTEEVGSKADYVAKYQGFDWPGGASGPTIGIGYDLGQTTHAEIVADWKDIVDTATLEKLLMAQGRQGAIAHAFCQAHRHDVTITWDQALKEFQDHEMPKWEARTAAPLPNNELLSGDSFGALVSLAYNRGAGGFTLHDDRHREMAAIRTHMVAKEFSKIPGEFLAMRRLWPHGGDLWRRRGHEAALFEQGLKQPAPPSTPPAAPATA